ncbi:MAG: hypothetical protein PVH19_00980 [Planctomycetia bacterium]
MRFDVTTPDRITPETVKTGYITGFERIPWRSEIRLVDNQLQVERDLDESGCFHMLWPVDRHGLTTVSTGNLIERERPYRLPLEFARGKIAQFRNQMSDWRAMGLEMPKSIQDKAEEAQGRFRTAIITQDSDPAQSAQAAGEALSLILDAGVLLTAVYANRTMIARRRLESENTCMLGVDLGIAPPAKPASTQILDAFNTANISLSWREIEAGENRREWEVFDRQFAWCEENGLDICAGPLFQLGPGCTPDWLCLFEDDPDAMRSAISQYVEAAVTRYRGRVQMWVCSGRTNMDIYSSLSEEERVQLTAHVVEQVASLDPETPRIISFDAPWAEYVGSRETDFPPLYFADALIRSGLGISGIMLEINFGYHPNGTYPRDPIDLNRLIDLWGGLGVPLYVKFCLPSQTGPDPKSYHQTNAVQPVCSPETQRILANRYVSLLVARAVVHGVFWSQLHDSQPHDYPHGGLFDSLGRPKPLVRSIAALRQAFF